MAFIQFEDSSGTAEVVVFPKLYAQVAQWLKDHTLFIITGTIDTPGKDLCKIKAQSIIPLDLALDQGTGLQGITVILPALFDDTLITTIKDSLEPGSLPLSFIVQENGMTVRITTKQMTSFSQSLKNLATQKTIGIRLAI